MKKIILLVVTLVLLFSCKSKPGLLEKIKNGISKYYESMKVKNYVPVSYSKLDTVAIINGIKTKTRLIHQYKAADLNNTIQSHTDTFEILIYNDDLVIRKLDPIIAEPQTQSKVNDP